MTYESGHSLGHAGVFPSIVIDELARTIKSLQMV